MNVLLSNYDIIEICQQLKINLIKCCFKEELIGNCQNGCYVINLDNIGGVGSHWICLYVSGNYACYFDSFGIIYPYEVQRFCKNKTIIYNMNQIQHIDDIHCGYFCIAFLHYLQYNDNKNMYLNDEMNNFIQHFSNNPSNNLKKLQNYFKTLYKRLN